ncbi:type IV toxin-antitoxin system AbiEi family antitoxin domain-containing protein [Cellulomonas sp. URHD0024]|uniref:type IV toxin-antitoxin system AbiEi family antitoxin domain-containing protein n=1 Tax=Cellulomonas sp. URHD0024 TaxID=1302620 RepID=UPI00041735E6|nr:type IV toxin-antitoxin system AbiEi family antitoxin domain-containing protein [Cellulomonas sp. URHD0024]
MDDVIPRRIADLGGAARRQDVVLEGADVRALDRLLQAGRVVRLAPGVYGVPGCSSEAVAAAVHGAGIGCVSAAARAGVAILRPPEAPHLVVPRGRGRSASRLRDEFPAVLHHESWFARGRARGAAVAPVGRALARMVLCLPTLDAVVALDSAFQKRLATIGSVGALLPATADVRMRRVLDLTDGRSRSPIETVARLTLRGAGLSVVAGVVVPMVGEVDLVVEGRVVVELDGFAHHSGRREFAEDRRRDRELTLQGYIVLRFTARDVLRDPDRLVATVRAAVTLSRGGRRAGRP